MVISDVNQITYNGNGVQTAWPFTFEIIDATDIRIMLIDSDGYRTNITSDYYVDVENSVVYYPGYAPGSEPPEAEQPPKVQSGQKIIVYRKLPKNQLANLGDKWPFQVIEKGLDKLTMLIQDVWGWLGSNIFQLSDVENAWDALGYPIHNVGEPINIDDAATKDYVDNVIAGIVAHGGNIVMYNNVAGMEADEDLLPGLMAVTKGYYTINDGGHSVYSIRAKIHTDVDDGKNIISLDNGNVAERILDDDVQFLFPANESNYQWDCQLIVTRDSCMMIDSGVDDADVRQYLIDYMLAHGIKKIDYFLLTHYHADHDGNISPFLNQSTVDFSQTKWYIPSFVTTGFASRKTAVINALVAAGADYTELSADTTLTLAPNVTVDIWGASSTYTDYITANTSDPTDLNPYSLLALVRHNNVNALYMGDGYYPATKAVLDFYDVPKIDILKIPHHGSQSVMNQGWDAQFYSKTACEYATCNYPTDRFSQLVTATNPLGSDKRFPIQYAYACGSQILPTHFGDVEIVSDGNNAELISNSRAVNSRYNPPPMFFYVDAAYTDTDADGSENKPYPDINTAIDALPDRLDPNGVTIIVKTGSYPSVNIVNFCGEFRIVASDGVVNIDGIFISNCTDVYFDNEFTTKTLKINKSNVTYNKITVSPDDSYVYANSNIYAMLPNKTYTSYNLTPISISGSTVFASTFIIDGGDQTSAYDQIELMYIYNTRISVRSLTIKDVTRPLYYVVALDSGTVFMIDDVASIETTDKEAFRLFHGAYLQINTITLAPSFTNNLIHYNGGVYEITSAARRGTTAERPDNAILPYLFFYMDTTVNCLTVKIANYWYKATDGSTV